MLPKANSKVIPLTPFGNNTPIALPTPKGRESEDALERRCKHLKIITTLETNVPFPIASLTAAQL